MSWFDSHCHVHEENEAVAIVAECAENGLGGLINVGTTLETTRHALAVTAELVRIFPDVSFGATAGIHPHDSQDVVSRGTFSEFQELVRQNADNNILVGIGECGLDFFYDNSDRKIQQQVFLQQIELANEMDLPLIIHTRDAWNETFAILRDTCQTLVIFHCFTGGPSELDACLAFNSFVSFSGIVTFKTAGLVAIAAQECPLDRMLVETDSPYLTPVPYRGTKNIPHRVSIVGSFIAGLKNMESSELARATFENTQKVLTRGK